MQIIAYIMLGIAVFFAIASARAIDMSEQKNAPLNAIFGMLTAIFFLILGYIIKT